MLSNITPTADDSFPKLKDFIFERKLGSGTYASVYKAINKNKNNEVVAIKCIKRSSLNEISTENLLREIEILKNIRNDNIVQLKDFQWNENYIYLILEYCAGGDLSNFIRSRRTIPEKYVRRFLQQIAFALKHLHSLGIAHMDLKPQNILLTSVNNPSLKLGDFGFAQKLRENSVGKSLKGSPLYMAPEILKYKRYDAKVDLWSVGVILYEVIFGYAPFVSNSFEELEKKILDDRNIEIPSNVMLSEMCKDLLKRLLQRNPKDRISFEQFFNHPFIDLEHMPDANSYNKARELFEKALKADQNKDYIFAQKTYLSALEYLIPAIQYEKDHSKKQDMREKAKKFLKRAEEIANISNNNNNNNNTKRPETPSRPSIPRVSSASGGGGTPIPIHRISSYTAGTGASTLTRAPSIGGATSKINQDFSSLAISKSNVFSQNQASIIDALMEACSNDEKAKYSINLCVKADERLKDENAGNLEEMLNTYQTAISVLLPFLQSLPKDSDSSKLLKKQIEKWLSNAETLKEKISVKSQITNHEMIQAEKSFTEDLDETNNQYINQCILQ